MKLKELFDMAEKSKALEQHIGKTLYKDCIELYFSNPIELCADLFTPLYVYYAVNKPPLIFNGDNNWETHFIKKFYRNDDIKIKNIFTGKEMIYRLENYYHNSDLKQSQDYLSLLKFLNSAAYLKLQITNYPDATYGIIASDPF